MKVAVYTLSAGTKDSHTAWNSEAIFLPVLGGSQNGRLIPTGYQPIYIHTYMSIPKIFKEPSLRNITVIIKFPKSKNRPENLWLFDENCQCFAIFEMIRIEQFFDSETFKESELGSWFFKSSKNRPRLVFISHIIHSLVSTIPYLYMWLSGWLIIYCHICNEEARSFVLDKNFICSFLSNKFSFKTQKRSMHSHWVSWA